MRKLVGIAALAVSAVLLSGCTTGAVDNGEVESNDDALTIGLITNQGNYYFQSIQDSLKALAEADGGQVLVVNTNSDAGAEAQAIQDFVQRQVDVILISVNSPDGSLASIRAANEAGVPVVCYNTCLSDEDTAKYTKGYIKSDDSDLGHQTGVFAAEYIKQNLDGVAKIAVLHCDRYEVCKLRRDAFEAALSGLDIEVVAEQEAFEADKANTIALDMLTAHPEIDAFWTVNEGALLGVRPAIKAASGHKKVVLFGTDISPQIAELLLNDEDILQATTGQSGEALAAASYEAAKIAKQGGVLSPFTRTAPGTLYSRADIPAVEKYLSVAK